MWNPIKTAPKNIFILVGFSEKYTNKDPSWEWPEYCSRIGVGRLVKKQWFDSSGDDLIKPSHWMYLPEPPKEK